MAISPPPPWRLTRFCFLTRCQAAEKGRLTCGSGDAEVQLAFSSDGKLLATASSLDSIILWDAATARESKRFNLPLRHEIRCLAYSPDGGKLAAACGGEGDGLCVLDIATAKIYKQIPTQRGVRALAYDSTGKLLAVAGEDNIVVYETDDYQPMRKFTKLNDTAACLAFAPDGRTLAAGMFGNAVRLFDLAAPGKTPSAGHGPWTAIAAWSIRWPGRSTAVAWSPRASTRLFAFGSSPTASRSQPGRATAAR